MIENFAILAVAGYAALNSPFKVDTVTVYSASKNEYQDIPGGKDGR
jgi:hypothetical protein